MTASIAAAAVPLASGAAPFSPASTARAAGGPSGDWARFDYDAQRSGVDPADTGINAGNVRQLRLRRVSIDGTVDSSAIELHAVAAGRQRRDVIFVTTTYGRTIALDPATGARLWEYVPPAIRSYQGSSQITNTAPIADPDRRFVYAASPDGRIHKLAIASGREVRSGHWPVRVTFDATHEKLASALNISGKSVIAVTGGYLGDAPPYQGHLVMIDRASGHITAVWNSLCSDRHHLIDPPGSCPASDSGIWARAGAVIEPGSGRILIATGNGPFNGSTGWGDSTLELSADGRRLLHNYTPTDQRQLEETDTDLGSTAPVLMPRIHGVRYVVQGGKFSTLRLLRLPRLNGARRAGPRLGGELQQIDSPGGDDVFTAPVAWAHNGRDYLFVADGAGTAAYVLAGARPRLRLVWRNHSAGTSPVLAGGLLYAYDPGGSIDVYEPISGHKLIELPAGSGHWNSPIVVGGRIIEPVGDANDHRGRGELDIYHLPGR